MPLTMKRKKGEAIRIGPRITVTIGETRGSHTAIHIEAPRSVPVWRAEIQDFHAGGDDDGDDICGRGVSTRADGAVDDAISGTAEHRTAN